MKGKTDSDLLLTKNGKFFDKESCVHFLANMFTERGGGAVNRYIKGGHTLVIYIDSRLFPFPEKRHAKIMKTIFAMIEI